MRTMIHLFHGRFYFIERRQTMLFSATQTRRTEDLAKISLKKEPLYIGVDDGSDEATVESLEQVNYHVKDLIQENK